MNSNLNGARKALRNAIASIKSGDKESARNFARQASSMAPELEQPWLILAAFSDLEDSLLYIEKALLINPNSQVAQDALAWVNQKMQTKPIRTEPVQAANLASVEIAEKTSEPPVEHILLAQSAQLKPAETELSPLLLEETPETITEPVSPEPAQAELVSLESVKIEPASAMSEEIHELPTKAAPPEQMPTVFIQPVSEATPEPVLEEEFAKPATATFAQVDQPHARASQPPSTETWTLPIQKRLRERGRFRRFFSSPGGILLWIVLALLAFVLVAGLTFLRPQLDEWLARFFPGEGCSPTLVLASHTYQLQNITTNADGSLPVPREQPDMAAWVEGTTVNTVFTLNPSSENMSLVSSIRAGDTATVTWANCNSTTYYLSLPFPSQLDRITLMDQTTTGITVIMPEASGLSSFVIKGDLQEEMITSFNTPDASSLQAEISLLETTTSPDGVALTVVISIYNYGQVAATLTSSDVSLTPENGSTIAPQISDPTLPIQLEPGTTTTIYFTFIRPSTATATLKILSVEYILDGY